LTSRVALIVTAARGALSGIFHADSTREALVVAAKGAERFLPALARGDVATEEIQAMRIATCKRCPWMQTEQAPGATGESTWCGKALTPREGPEVPPGERTCGCLLAAKVAVASESCPQDKWPAETPCKETE
jgi:hypothetical protein